MNRPISAISGPDDLPPNKKQKVDPQLSISGLITYDLMKKAIHSLKFFGNNEIALTCNNVKVLGYDNPLSLYNIIYLSICKAFENKYLLTAHEKLASKWVALNKTLSKTVALSPETALIIKKINAHISQQNLFPSASQFTNHVFYENLFHPILLDAEPHNPYLSPYSKEFGALASVSKMWNLAIYEIQNFNMQQYNKIKTQEALFLNQTFNTAEAAVDFIIKNKLEIANLNNFEDLSNELLRKLFDENSNIKHLIIASHLITELPQDCKQLQTLNCHGCAKLSSLPELPQLTSLDCSFTGISSLPELPRLKTLDCSNCIRLNELPELSRLISLNCHNCDVLSFLPNLPQLTSLNCSLCATLSRMPDLPHLKSLDCAGCDELSSLSDLPQLTKLSCNHCSKLSNLPDLPQLIDLVCDGSPLESLSNLPQLKRIFCSDCKKLTELFNLPQLTELDCDGCNNLKPLADLPELKSLVCGNFDYANLEEFIPHKLLMQLTVLTCCSAKIKQLPACLAQLKFLNCEDCEHLESLPYLPQLENLYYDNCPNLKVQPENLPKRMN